MSYDGPHDLAWTPDENLLSFLVDEDTTSVIIYNREKDSFTTAHTFPVSIDSVRWSSVGPYFLFATEVYPSTTIEETVAIDEQKNSDYAQAMVFDHMFVYHWDTYETGKYRHVMYMKLSEEDTDVKYVFNGTIHDVMKDLDGNCPAKPDCVLF